MLVKRIKLRWRIARALFVGIVVSLLIPELLAAFLLPRSWGGLVQLPKDIPHPTYLHDIAPPFSSAIKNTPADSSGDVPLIPINLGMDLIHYSYGLGYFDPNYTPWDTTRTDSPPSVNLTRFRFGFPWRSLTWDDLSTGASVNIPAVMDYHMKMYERAGIDRGIGVSFISPGRRLPIAPIWGGLILNILFWSSLWFFPGVIWRSARYFLRKRRGLCLVCGYAIEDLERCPECGTKVAGYDFSDA
jgi:hypothetical protein